ncbi:type VII secretion target [Glycomyces tenuis]|uniref:type VII secretion target n=1 Tax=Glycomyces tenuis TaxID=58116 RepID=UPI000428CCC6|nr:type VII secretion target [Glycomyces tenuis]
MGDHIDVEPEALIAHAGHLDEIRDRFGAILSAIDSIEQDNEAYGIICQFLPPVLAARQGDQKEFTAMAQENLELLAQALRDTADAYTAADEEAAEEQTRLLNEL